MILRQLVELKIDIIKKITSRGKLRSKFQANLDLAPNQYFRALIFLLSPFQEQEMGNYKQAHQLLFRTYQDLKSQQLDLPQELWRRLMLLHSYVPRQCTAMTTGENQRIVHSNHSTFDAVELLHFFMGLVYVLIHVLLFKSKDLMN